MSTRETSPLQVVTTPTLDWLAENATVCRSRMLIASPYVNNGITALTNLVPKDVAKILVTRTDLRDFALGASDLETLCTLSEAGVNVRSLSDLHAKVYVFDTTAALVTSANATHSGMRWNWECGLATREARVVAQLARSILSGLGADRPPRRMAIADLAALRAPLRVIKASIQSSTLPRVTAQAAPSPDAVFSVDDHSAFLSQFSGWLRLTLEGVMVMPKASFRLDELLTVCARTAARRYPRNRHVPEKLRQQLQELRDIGLVEFVERGVYRYTIETNSNE